MWKKQFFTKNIIFPSLCRKCHCSAAATFWKIWSFCRFRDTVPSIKLNHHRVPFRILPASSAIFFVLIWKFFDWPKKSQTVTKSFKTQDLVISFHMGGNWPNQVIFTPQIWEGWGVNRRFFTPQIWTPWGVNIWDLPPIWRVNPRESKKDLPPIWGVNPRFFWEIRSQIIKFSLGNLVSKL